MKNLASTTALLLAVTAAPCSYGQGILPFSGGHIYSGFMISTDGDVELDIPGSDRFMLVDLSMIRPPAGTILLVFDNTVLERHGTLLSAIYGHQVNEFFSFESRASTWINYCVSQNIEVRYYTAVGFIPTDARTETCADSAFSVLLGARAGFNLTRQVYPYVMARYDHTWYGSAEFAVTGVPTRGIAGGNNGQWGWSAGVDWTIDDIYTVRAEYTEAKEDFAGLATLSSRFSIGVIYDLTY